MKDKKLKQSPVVIALYVLALLGLAYTFIQIGSTVKYIVSYYSSYGMKPGFSEVLNYVMQAVFQPLSSSILIAAAAYILNAVRALNPSNYISKEELSAIKTTKKVIKESAKKSRKTKEVVEIKVDEEPEKVVEPVIEEPIVEESVVEEPAEEILDSKAEQTYRNE